MESKPKVYGLGRRCVICNAVLSRYNKKNKCQHHSATVLAVEDVYTNKYVTVSKHTSSNGSNHDNT